MPDILSALPRWPSFRPVLAAHIARSRAEGAPLSLLYVDADWVQLYAVTHTPQAANVYLIAIVAMLADSVKAIASDDTLSHICRIDQDDYLLVLPNRSEYEAEALAEQVRAKAPVVDVPYRSKMRHCFGLSIGVASFPRDGHDPDSLLQQAERRMVLAKAAGKNRVVVAGHAQP